MDISGSIDVEVIFEIARASLKMTGKVLNHS